MTPSRQEINHATSSSSSSTSPTTTVSSDSETREREDLSGINSHPVHVSSSNVEEMIEPETKSAVAILKKGDWHERRPVTRPMSRSIGET